MSALAQELSRRASPGYLKEQAKEAALYKTAQWKDDVLASPLWLGILGGAVGAAIGGLFARGRRSRELAASYVQIDRGGGTWREREGYRFGVSGGVGDAGYRGAADIGGGGGGVGDIGAVESKAGGVVDDVTSKAGEFASELKEKAGEAVEAVKERTAEAIETVREKVPSGAEIRRTAEENPLFIALGGVAIGAVAALLLPVSRKERELLEPVKQRAGEAIGELGSKLSEQVQGAQQKLAGEQQSEPEAGMQGYHGQRQSTDLLPH